MKNFRQIKAILAGLMLSSSVVPVATADDTEIYTISGVAGTTANPKILFVVDTSGSMGTTSKVKPAYNPAFPYTGDCDPDGIYYTNKSCAVATSADYFERSALVCDHAVVGYDFAGNKISPPQDGSLLMIGTYSDQLAQFNPVSKKWRELQTGTTAEQGYIVECFSDSGIHGSGSGSADYIKDGGTGFTTTATPHAVWAGGAGNLQLFDGNYLNYKNTVFTAGELVSKSYLDQVKSAVEIMVRGNTRVNIGLMRFDSKSAANGGAIQYPILDVGEDRNDFFQRLDTLSAGGWTPLSEVYYEALLYFGGKEVDFSKLANPGNQVVNKTLKSGNVEFQSPISSVCDKSYIVLLTDGKPTNDEISAARKTKLSSTFTGSCNSNLTPSVYDDDNRDAATSDTSSVDNCLDELSEWAFTNDVAVESGNPAHEGVQNVRTYTIGFKLDPNVSEEADAILLLEDTGRKGNPAGKKGSFFADDEAELISIFNQIISTALEVNTTFASPAVSVNAFNRSTHLNDLYFTLFKPSEGNHWDGNLKKYKLDFDTDRKPFIADADGIAAVDPATGFFSEVARSFWSVDVDGKEVSAGGAASVFSTGGGTRKVYTFTGNYKVSTNGVREPVNGQISTSANKVEPGNTDLTDALLGITGFGEYVAGTPYRETLINWASGLDALSKYGAGNTYSDARPQMGDPLHAEPALVQYGEDVSNNPDLVAYVATNDGYLHAFDVDTGVEEFSFIPKELLSDLSVAMENDGGRKLYGLDGNVVAWINDADGDGTISGTDEHVYLYVGMRRGGRDIYALDVTDRSAPKFLWKIEGGVGDYAELGDTWSTVNVRKIKDAGVDREVLIFGGGYDAAQDSALVRTTDTVGRAVFIADAITGERLWTGGNTGDLVVDDMDYSIPARVVPLDISADGYVDRLYVADMGGQIFRFDIDNKSGGSLGSAITGGRIADLAGPAEIDARRFYYPPDVALVDAPEGKYHGVVISSGYRAHPLNTTIHDRIYLLKDTETRLITDSSRYITLVESDLHDATSNLAGGDSGAVGDIVADAARAAELGLIQGAGGWYISLDDEDNPGTWLGEKGLAEPLILENTIILTTYTPDNDPPVLGSCLPSVGLGKVFFLNILDATPAFPSDVDLRPERHTQLIRGGIPPTPTVLIPKDGEATLCVGTECETADFGLGVRKTYWYEVEE